MTLRIYSTQTRGRLQSCYLICHAEPLPKKFDQVLVKLVDSRSQGIQVVVRHTRFCSNEALGCDKLPVAVGPKLTTGGSPAGAVSRRILHAPAPPGRCRVQPLVRRYVECYAGPMTIKATVRDGRLVLDEPTTLPEGTEVELLPLDPGDWLDDADRAALHAALAQSEADISAGRVVDASDVLKGLRAR